MNTIDSPNSIPRLIFYASLPLPPGVNRTYRNVHIRLKDGREFNTLAQTQEAKRFKQDANLVLLSKKTIHHYEEAVLHAIRQSKRKTPLFIEIDFYYATLWKRDIDGGEKAVIDAVFWHLGLNDNLIVEKRTRKLADPEDPRVDVEIRLLN